MYLGNIWSQHHGRVSSWHMNLESKITQGCELSGAQKYRGGLRSRHEAMLVIGRRWVVQSDACKRIVGVEFQERIHWVFLENYIRFRQSIHLL